MPSWYGLEIYIDGDYTKPNPLVYEMLTQECGDYKYEWELGSKYHEFRNGTSFESVYLINDEFFDVENYNEKSIRKESKLVFVR